jgi:hypothetical protein
MARWRCRADIAKDGFRPKNFRLWDGVTPNDIDVRFIQEMCQRLQNEMLTFERGGIERVGKYDGTIAGLITCYQVDSVSPYRKLQPRSRESYDFYCKRLERDITVPLSDLKVRSFHELYNKWSEGGKFTMAHHVINMLRILVNFGAIYLEEPDCQRISGVLRLMKFKSGKPREEILTVEQASLIRDKAHDVGRPSIALAQAFQSECLLRQKDCVGEWVLQSEKGISDVISGGMKWLKGMRWEEIDQNLVLRHLTSKRQKMLEVPLANAPMIVQEFDRQFPGAVSGEGKVSRDKLPAKGPIIVNERTQVPWTDDEYRRQWRILATACGIPKTVKNMDSRAGGITEATEAGAELEFIKHAATHGDISMTQRYARDGAGKTAKVLSMRAAHRANKTGKAE